MTDAMTIGVVVFSYNRPALLREALASVMRNNPDQVIICDDGSDVPVEVPADARVSLISRPPRPASVRVRRALLAELAEEAVGKLTTEYVTWLCDDDLMAEGWLDHIRSRPPRALYIGDVVMFKQGEEPTQGRSWHEVQRVDVSQMTTGNFIHRTDLPVRWPADRIMDHDAAFVHAVLQATYTSNPRAVVEPRVAMYFRWHEHNLSRYRGNELALTRRFEERKME